MTRKMYLFSFTSPLKIHISKTMHTEVCCAVKIPCNFFPFEFILKGFTIQNPFVNVQKCTYCNRMIDWQPENTSILHQIFTSIWLRRKKRISVDWEETWCWLYSLINKNKSTRCERFLFTINQITFCLFEHKKMFLLPFPLRICKWFYTFFGSFSTCYIAGI